MQIDASNENESKRQKDALFEKEFLPNIHSLYNFAFRLTLDQENANDLVQETLLKAYRFINSYAPETNAKAWLFRILKNTFINEFRKQSREPHKVDYSDVEFRYSADDSDDLLEVSPNLKHETQNDRVGDEIAKALNGLEVDFRVVIVLCDLEGFSYEEMAKILDIPIGTVRSRLHRARGLLRIQLQNYAQEMGYTKASEK